MQPSDGKPFHIQEHKDASTIFTPDMQRHAASELHQLMNDALHVFKGRENSDKVRAEMSLAIQNAVKTWSQKYPILNKHNIGFSISFDPVRQALTIHPSPDFAKLLAGLIV